LHAEEAPFENGGGEAPRSAAGVVFCWWAFLGLLQKLPVELGASRTNKVQKL
jgi:hypothetical protein